MLVVKGVSKTLVIGLADFAAGNGVPDHFGHGHLALVGDALALMVQSDRYHRPAREFFRSIAKEARLLTSNYVLAETYTWLVYHDLRQSALRLRQTVASAEQTHMLSTLWVTREVHDAAWEYLEGWQDQDFSFTDCTSFSLCNSQHVDFVFGFDRHFRSTGFDLQPGP